jgi:hypothetical protein
LEPYNANYNEWITLEDGESISNNVLKSIVVQENKEYKDYIFESLKFSIPDYTHYFVYEFNNKDYPVYLFFNLYKIVDYGILG